MARALGKSIKYSLILMFLLSFSIASSAEVSAKSEELAESLEETKSLIASHEQTQRQILGSLYEINKRMKTMSERRSGLADKVFAAEGDVKNTARSIAELEDKISGQRKNLSLKLRTLYLISGQSSFRALFSATSSHDLDKNLKFLKIISDHDYKLIREYEASLKILKKKREVLKGQVERLVRYQREMRRQESELLSEQQEKIKILDKLRVARSGYIKRLKSIRRSAENLDSESKDEKISRLLEPSFFEKKGQLNKPVAGELLRAYGLVQDETYKFRLSHKGLFIGTETEAEIKSIFSGRVAYSGTIPGYGSTIILDHGDHYYSIYAFGSKRLVREGEKIKEGQTIAYSGRSLHEDRLGLYLEIRHFSDAIDPQPWFKDIEPMKQRQL